MSWYYIQDATQHGPVERGEFARLCGEGEIGEETLVFTGGMSDWMPLGAARDAGFLGEGGESGGVEEKGERVECPTCTREVSPEELIPMEDMYLCPYCRDNTLQQIREGRNPFVSTLPFATFGVRCLAWLIDYVVQYLGGLLLGFFFGLGVRESVLGDLTGLNIALVILYYVLSLLLPLLYAVVFLGHPRLHATPGMLLLKLKCVRPDESRVTYLRALGRYGASWITSMTLMIGYLMPLWDEERRTLHDLIADTRVIRRGP